MPRPRIPVLSTALIHATALRIIDTEGLDGLSMRKLAAELGVQAASLYGHVNSKDELLHAVVNEIAEGVDVSVFATADWREGIRAWAFSYRAVLLEHPNVVPFVAAGPARRPASLRAADAVHGALTGAGWPPRYATMIGASVDYLVIGSAMGSFSRGFDDDVNTYADQYPNLVNAPALREHAEEIDAGSFELALTALLAGLEPLYQQFTRSRPA